MPGSASHPVRPIALVATLVAALLLTIPGVADARAETFTVTREDAWSFHDLNPCSGESHEVTVAGTVVARVTIDGKGTLHAAVKGRYDVHTDSGFAGHQIANVTERYEDGGAALRVTVRVRLLNGDGDVLLVRIDRRHRVVDGELVREHVGFRLFCPTA